MQPGRVSIGEAVSWVGGGWKIFSASPGTWLLIGLVHLLISFAAQLVPFLGGVISVIIVPIFTAGLMYAAREADAGRELRLDYLFQGFREHGRTGPLFALGGIYVGSMIAIAVLCVLMLVMMGVTTDLPRELAQTRDLLAPRVLNVLLVILIALALFIPVLMALYYAAPLVMFHGVPVWTALGSSFRACILNFIPLVVFGLVLFVLFLVLSLFLMAIMGAIIFVFVFAGSPAEPSPMGIVVTALLAFLLMFLTAIALIPILAGMNFRSYRGVYKGHPEDGGAGMAG